MAIFCVNQPTNTPFTQDILSEQIFFPSRNKIWNQVIHLPTAGKKRLERCFAGQKRGVLSDKIPWAHRIHGTGIFTYMYHEFLVNVGKYTIHGSYGWECLTNKVFFQWDFSEFVFYTYDLFNSLQESHPFRLWEKRKSSFERKYLG